MSTFKKTKVVMLPTNEKAEIGTNVIVKHNTTLAYGKKVQEPYNMVETEQHLYFLSDEEIKEGDWFLMNGCIIRQCKSTNKEPYTIHTVVDTTRGIHHVSVCEKIIATTDKSLIVAKDTEIVSIEYNLPQPSQSFVEKYVEEYNKGNVITEVLVEYGYSYRKNNDGENIGFKVHEPLMLKMNSKDNTITIRKAKDSWSREEVKQLFDKMFATDIIDANVKKVDFDKWIEENL